MNHLTVIGRRKAKGWLMGVVLSFWLVSGLPGRLCADPVDSLAPGVYLVVGVFAVPINAEQYVNTLRQQGVYTQMGYHAPDGYVYVYTRQAATFDHLRDPLHQLRQNPSFSDAWLFKFTSSAGFSSSSDEENNKNAKKPISLELEEQVNGGNELVLVFDAVGQNFEQLESAQLNLIATWDGSSLGKTSSGSPISISKGYVIDSGLQILPEALGYRSEPIALSLSNQDSSKVKSIKRLNGDSLSIKLILQPWRPGDIQVLFRTYFYPNSSVMRPRSQPQMEELIELLKKSSSQRVCLHGHTNGSGRGYVYLCSEESQNFFTLYQNKDHKKRGVGSVKLSAMRAQTIRAYLIHRGIAPDRIETKGWGGKKALYDPDTPLGRNNIRVEVELLKSDL